MENHPQVFDVCVVCALPEEVRAFLNVVRLNSEKNIEEHTSVRYGYPYRSASLKNDKGELLTLHISWLPRYGPQEMTLHLSRVLEECQPRIALMTGICAGDAARGLQLGDLVVAERTFTYDNGKISLDEQGRQVHQHDTLTYQLDANILQFLGLFDAWEPLVAGLTRPSEIRLERSEVHCHIKAMASGSAVRADNPFQEVRTPVRGTVAIDMEGAAFGLVMSRHPRIPWLVVKGVCDYADRTKGDVYHEYAATAAATYALSFIQVYVTAERLPRTDVSPNAGRAAPASIWNVPYRRNLFFTGREDLLMQLREKLATARTAALTQPQAISGLGGVGKTQIALEYAYRYRSNYRFIFWVRAVSREIVISDFVTIAELLCLPAKSDADQNQVILAVKQWFAEHDEWLLIFDNADDVAMLGDFIPPQSKGHIVLTSRAQALGSLAQRIDVEKMGMVEGTLLLLRRAKLLAEADPLEQASEEQLAGAEAIVIEMDFLPLALDQAGAYIDETGRSLSAYLDLYRTHRKELLLRRSQLHPEPVATTWSLSFQKIQHANPGAADLLRFCAFLDPDAIPEDLISRGGTHLSPVLQRTAVDPFKLDEAIEELRKFSLVRRHPDTKTVSLHRLVQAVLKDAMGKGLQKRWAERAVQAVNSVFPEDSHDIATWPECLRYLGQAQACNTLIEQYTLHSLQSADLLDHTGMYLDRHALYAIAEPLLKQAVAIYEQLSGLDHPTTATARRDLACLYYDWGKYAQAEPLLQSSLTIREQHLGQDHLKTADSLNNLALLYDRQGKYAQAESLYQRSFAIYKQQLGLDHPGITASLNNLASFYQQQRKYTKAAHLYQRALAICEQQLGLEHPDTARILGNLALLYYDRGGYTQQEHPFQQFQAFFYRLWNSYPQTESLYQRILAIRERQLGPEHPETALCLNNLALFYLDQNKYAQAEPLFARALAISERYLGPLHPSTALTLNNLGFTYQGQHQYARAEPFLQRALAINEQVLGPEHLDTAQSLNNLALLYFHQASLANQNKYTQAKHLYERALAIYDQKLGRLHPTTQMVRQNYRATLYGVKLGRALGAVLEIWRWLLARFLGATHPRSIATLNNLALFYDDQKQFDKAEQLYQRILAIREQQSGPEHSDTLDSLSTLAFFYLEQKRYTDAEALYQRVLTIREQQSGPEHPDTGATLNSLAFLYSLQGEKGKAEQLYRRVLAIREQQLGPQHTDTAITLTQLAAYSLELGKYQEAENFYQRALTVFERQLGGWHLIAAQGLGSFYVKLGRYQEAEQLYLRIIALYEERSGDRHLDTAECLTYLAIFYERQGKYSAAQPLYERILSIYEQQPGAWHPDIGALRERSAALSEMMRGEREEATQKAPESTP